MAISILRRRYVASDHSEAVAFIDGAYGRSTSYGTATANAAWTVTSLSAAALSLDRVVSTGVRAALVTELDDNFRAATYLGGRIGYEFANHPEVAAQTGSCLRLPAGQVTIDWHDCELLFLQIPIAEMLEAAAAAAELEESVPLRFTGICPVSHRAADRWRAVLAMTWSELAAPDSALREPLVYREMFDLVAAAAVSTFPNTALTTGYVPGPGRVGPAALRRALAFVEANASLPISVEDIAGAAGTSARAMRHAFRNHLDTTPSGYLRRVRLAAAHQDLQLADPELVDLAAVAARWGFRDPRRFAAAYREAYGRTPPGDLRR